MKIKYRELKQTILHDWICPYANCQNKHEKEDLGVFFYSTIVTCRRCKRDIEIVKHTP